MATLSEQGLSEWLRNEAAIADRPGQYDRLNDIADRVEAILDRLAKVEALADDWEANGNSRELGDPTDRVWFKCATELRAALASDPTHTQNGAQA